MNAPATPSPDRPDPPTTPEQRGSPESAGTAPAARNSKRLLTRRRFLQALGGSVAAMAGTGVYAWRIEPHWIEIVRRDLPIAHLPDALAGRTLALVSDLHVGRVVDPDYLRGAMDAINALSPDLLAIVGDLMHCRGDERIAETVGIVGRLRLPPLGAYVVLGNHDYGRRWSHPEVAEKLSAALTGIGHRVLRNERVWIAGGENGPGLQLVGLDDLWAHGPGAGGAVGRFFNPQAVMSRLRPDAAAVVLVHNPDATAQPGWAGYRGWVLCGHSHGGQVDLPLIGTPIVPVRDPRLVAGEVDLDDGRRVYVTRGVGYLKRVRLGCRPEIALFTLRAG